MINTLIALSFAHQNSPVQTHIFWLENAGIRSQFNGHHVFVDMVEMNGFRGFLGTGANISVQPSLFPKYLGAYGVVALHGEPLGQRGKTRVLSFKSLRALMSPGGESTSFCIRP